MVRLARAHSFGCKSRRQLITASEAKRNCTRVTECGEAEHDLSGTQGLGGAPNVAKRVAANSRRWWRNRDGRLKTVLTIAHFHFNA